MYHLIFNFIISLILYYQELSNYLKVTHSVSTITFKFFWKDNYLAFDPAGESKIWI